MLNFQSQFFYVDRWLALNQIQLLENLMQPQSFKFGQFQDGNDTKVKQFFYPNIWNIEKFSGTERLIIAPESGQIDLIIELSQILPEPFGILYVLGVPRGGNEEGRYQNKQPVSRAEMEAFLNNFREFFENDARHHIWIVSLPSKSMFVYDKHNVIYAYGELEKFKQILIENDLTQSDVIFPEPHIHSYNPKFDADETRVLTYAEWIKFPLAKGDN